MYYLGSSFNPRTHEGCDFFSIDAFKAGTTVSIHAPTRGATPNDTIYYECEEVSIHAPTRGATESWNTRNSWGHVSIHAPTRGATTGDLCIANIPEVSIHAPTRGATMVVTGPLI